MISITHKTSNLKIPKPSLISRLLGKIKNRSLIYGYSNARIHAMKASLLSTNQIEKLLYSENINSLIGLLEQTSYKKDISQLAIKYTKEELVEHAINHHFCREIQKVLKIAPNGSKPVLTAMLQRYDISNIKTILLAKALQKKKEEFIDLLMPAGQLSMRFFEKMIDAEDTIEAAKMLVGTDFEIPHEILQRGNVHEMIKHIEKNYYSSIFERTFISEYEDTKLHDFSTLEIDKKNILDNLRCKLFTAQGHECAIKKGGKRPFIGRITESTLNRIHSLPTIEDEIKEVEKILGIEGLNEKYNQHKSIAFIELEIEKRVPQKHSFNRYSYWIYPTKRRGDK
ncbi:MAG: V-type ATPase subunit [Candidatus Anstonellales archaeon]